MGVYIVKLIIIIACVLISFEHGGKFEVILQKGMRFDIALPTIASCDGFSSFSLL